MTEPNLGFGIQRVTVAGLEQFVAFQWVGLYCDHPGCERSFNIEHATRGNAHALRAGAVEDGWSCDDRGDFCPDHKVPT